VGLSLPLFALKKCIVINSFNELAELVNGDYDVFNAVIRQLRNPRDNQVPQADFCFELLNVRMTFN
jgi:hypothetical protein